MNRVEKLADFISKIKGQLIVSCQATPQEALFGADIMAKMAISAVKGGAKGIRANTPADVQAIRQAVDVPLIGLYKVVFPGTPVIITATIEHALAIAEAGADVIAIDATFRLHPEDEVPELIRKIHEQTDCLVMADISNFEEAEAAMISGADVVSTTLSGYTDYTPKLDGPDLELVREIASKLPVPLFAEGRYHYPE
ncbi:MAG: N-acetylmannosamine-6-phosphate 2-epimerase, partial [Anaerolineaceae bacterium]|nr:N-acetylmannosamine-6-phosphate 2-epimerase [Anaerolineaceae bacterium]